MSPAPQDADAPRPRADWGRVADGVFLAGLGIFFLLATTRGVPDGFWIEAVSFWPVLLVSAGIRIVFDKTALPWGVVLGPVVVLATLFWLAWGHAPKPLPPGEWHAVTAERPPGTDRARVSADLAGVQLDLEARPVRPRLLAEGRAASRDRTPRIRVDDRDGEATVRLRGRQGGFLMIGTRREVWELGVTDAVPLTVDVEGVFVRTTADLRKAWPAYIEVAGAFNAATLRLPPTADPVTVRFKGAFSTFDVTVPEGTPVRFNGPGFPIVWADKGPAGDGVSDEEPGYNVILEGAFCRVDIEEGPAPEGGWPALRPPRKPTVQEEEENPDRSPPEDGGGPPPEDPEGEARPPAEAPPGESAQG